MREDKSYAVQGICLMAEAGSVLPRGTAGPSSDIPRFEAV